MWQLKQEFKNKRPGEESARKAVLAKTHVFEILLGFHAKHNLHFQDSTNCDSSFEDLFNLMKIILTDVVWKMQHYFL